MRNVIITGLVLTIAIVAAIITVWVSRPEPFAITIIPPAPTATPEPSATPPPMLIFVSGAINHPDGRVTVQLPAGGRVQDALEAAGGAAPNADLNRLNPVEILRDGDAVCVLRPGESLSQSCPPGVAGDVSSDQVNINTATLEELDSLPGIGPSIAQRIIDYREANGPFANLEALTSVSGIGPATIENLTGLVNFDTP